MAPPPPLLSSSHESSLHQSRESKRKKHRKIGPEIEDQKKNRWKNQSEQRTYSAKLYEALCQVRRNSSPSVSSPPEFRAVKDAADRFLAVAAGGRTRWSRAILRRSGLLLRMRRTFKNRHRKAIVKVATGTDGRMRKKKRNRGMTLPEPLNRRFRVFGRLIPGCRKLSFSNLVEEATDYVAALEMQVRALAELSELLSVAGADAQPNPPARLGSSS